MAWAENRQTHGASAAMSLLVYINQLIELERKPIKRWPGERVVFDVDGPTLDPEIGMIRGHHDRLSTPSGDVAAVSSTSLAYPF